MRWASSRSAPPSATCRSSPDVPNHARPARVTAMPPNDGSTCSMSPPARRRPAGGGPARARARARARGPAAALPQHRRGSPLALGARCGRTGHERPAPIGAGRVEHRRPRARIVDDRRDQAAAERGGECELATGLDLELAAQRAGPAGGIGVRAQELVDGGELGADRGGPTAGRLDIALRSAQLRARSVRRLIGPPGIRAALGGFDSSSATRLAARSLSAPSSASSCSSSRSRSVSRPASSASSAATRPAPSASPT